MASKVLEDKRFEEVGPAMSVVTKVDIITIVKKLVILLLISISYFSFIKHAYIVFDQCLIQNALTP